MLGDADNCHLANIGKKNKKIPVINFDLWLKSLHPLDMVIDIEESQETNKLKKYMVTGVG